MKNNKGFTLVELLAVIVILAIVALVVVPVVMNVIKDARKKSAIESFRGYMDAVEKTIIRDSMKTTSELPSKDSNGCYNLNELNKHIKIKGDKPVIDDDDDKLCIKDNKITSISEVSMHGYALEYKNGKILFNGKYVEDTTIPEITLGSITATKNSITIPYEVQSGASGVTVTCEYGTSESYGNNGTIEDNKCVISGLQGDTKYYFRLNSKTGKKKTASTTGSEFTACEYSTNQKFNFDYTGAKQTFQTKCTGRYKLEVWGAEGGYRSSSASSGKGGYTAGIINLDKNKTLYVYSGGSGNSVTTATSGIYPGGFNGGGYRYAFKGGGGASDIRIGTDSLYARVIVAGGGGSDGASSASYKGGNAGGLTGTRGSFGCGSYGYGGTQNASTYTSLAYIATQGTTNSSSYNAGGFGFGGFGVYRSNGYGGAGGGGWYGGQGTYPDSSADDDGGGGGGSSYVYTSSTASNYPSGCLLNSAHYLESTQMIDGGSSMTSPSGSNETGHTGNGYARITYLGK